MKEGDRKIGEGHMTMEAKWNNMDQFKTMNSGNLWKVEKTRK
jgi:hypothetical protein